MTRARLLSIASFCVSAGLLGCGGANSPAPARVSGSLAYKGQPIKAGTMCFHTPEGVAFEAKVSGDGTYAAEGIPVGELVVTVETESLSPAKTAAHNTPQAKKILGSIGSSKRSDRPGGAPSSAPEDPAKDYIKLPAKYANAKTSPLTVTVKAGRQIHNIDLTD